MDNNHPQNSRDTRGTDLPPKAFKRPAYRKWMDRAHMPFLLIGAGVLLLLIGFIVFLPDADQPGNGNATAPASAERIAALQKRVKQLDRKVATLENRVKNDYNAAESKDAAGGGKQNKSLRMQKILERLDTLASRINRLENTDTPSPPPTNEIDEKKHSESADKTGPEYYEVRPGENPYTIAKKHDMSLKTLLDINNMDPGAVLQPGDRVRVRKN
ncbi:MAG: LysM peptidoglycan-binding domain-containing protein [Thermodesulfobacteriota bacterium]